VHLTPFSLYLLDPMRILLLISYLLSHNSKNAFFLAVTIPLFSLLASGHPPLLKAVLICIELLVNIGLFIFLLEKVRWFVPIVLFLSILASKLVYYMLKFLLQSFLIMDGELVTTSLTVQLVIAIGITIIFSFFFGRQAKLQFPREPGGER
jgi:hypothetical protein